MCDCDCDWNQPVTDQPVAGFYTDRGEGPVHLPLVL